jgi:predicted transcriptional regulator
VTRRDCALAISRIDASREISRRNQLAILEENTFIELTAEIVAAYVSKNSVQASSLPELIASVHASVAGLGNPVVAAPEPAVPAVNPKKSIFPDYLVSLEDGKKLKTLKRHLSSLGLTPAEYRAKWGLAADYPMVAPNYKATRSALAKKIGLGRKPAAPAPVKAKAPAKRRAKKAA